MDQQRMLGDYNIIKLIGQGTLGMVYLAEHRFMKKQFALKILPEELSSDRGFIQRFEEEVGALSSLEHPNIVKIHNISFSQGHYFLVLDCIVDEHGETTNLAQYVTGLGRRLEEEEILYLLRQVAAPLTYAHGKKIGNRSLTHRGLKPNNILVGHGPSGIDLYLSDFGLTRIIGAGAVLTRTYKNVAEALGIGLHLISQKAGQDKYFCPPIDQQKLIPLHASFLQNYAFLAPEQKRLDSTYPVDTKADVYAFGILAYFLLMGELPEGIFDLPSSRGTYRYQWDELLYSCLQNNPAQRPINLVEALEAVKQHEKTALFTSSSRISVSRERSDVAFCDEGIALAIAEKKNAADDLLTGDRKLIEGVNTAEKAGQVERGGLIGKGESFGNEGVEQAIPMLQEMTVKYIIEQPVMKEQEEALAVVAAAAAAIEVEIAPSMQETQSTSTLKPFLQSPKLERPQSDPDPAAVFQVNSVVKSYSPERRDVSNVKPLLIEMVIIEGGEFMRGSKDGNRDEMPRHQISLPSFAIDIHPVTNEQFVRFLEVMGGEKDSNHNDIIRLKDSRIKRSGGKLSIESGYSKHPVVGVTWYGAVAYARWVGKRLPTEAEWEVASRGGVENSLYPTGDELEKTQANFFSSDTTAVMSYAPNPMGLYDMAGNVYEWCHDWYGYNYYEVSIQEPENPQGPLQGVYRVLRGGCWKSLKEDLRCSRRHRNNPGTVNGTYGFRCATDVRLT